jgi:predicted Zn-dependent peptidase
MIRRAIAATLTATALIAAPMAGASAQSYPARPALGAPKPFAVPASETYRLPNGMQVTLIPYGQVPKAVVSLRIYAGGLDAGERTGLNSLTMNLLSEGAAGRTGAQIAEAAAAMGGNLGVSGDQHETSLSLGVLSEFADDALRLIADVARRPDFPGTELERIRAGVLRNLAVARSQPGPAAEAALAAAYFGTTHPYGRLFPSETQVKAYTIDDVRRFHVDNFGAKRARLYIAGQFDAAAVRAAIAEAYGDWQPGPERLSLPPKPQPGPRVILVNRPGAPQSTLRVAFPAPVAGTAQDVPFRVTNALLGGSFTSRITKNIREEKGYTYSPGSGVRFNPAQALWAFNADVSTDVTGAALKEVIGEIRELQTTAPPNQEALGIRTWMAGTFVLQNASPAGLIGSLANRDFHGLPANWLESYVPTVLAVQPAEMQRLAREQLPLDKMTLVVVGDLAKVTPQLKALPELKNANFQTVQPF